MNTIIKHLFVLVFLCFISSVYAVNGSWHLIRFHDKAMNHFYSVSFSDKATHWIGGTYLYRTTDNGQTWNELFGSTHDPEVTDISFVDNNKGWVAAKQNGLLYTSDGGMNWQQVTGDLQNWWVNSVCFVDDTTGWVITGSGYQDNLIWSTKNAGMSWIDVTPPELTESGIFLESLYFTTDFFNRWKEYDASFAGAKELYRAKMHFINGNTGWLKTALCLLHTNNGGEDWKITKEGCVLDFMVIGEDTVYTLLENDSFHENVLSLSTDGGNTFNDLPSPGNKLFSVYFLNCNLGWLAGVDKIYNTANGGTSWQLQYELDSKIHQEMEGYTIEWEDPRQPFIYDIFFNPDSTGYAVGAGNVFYKFSYSPLGDLDNTGSITIFDLLKLLSILSQEPALRCYTADLNNDGTVDVNDLIELLAILTR